MMLTPAASASRVPVNRTARPSSRSSPSKSGITPDRIFINVLLPAPFSPTMACSSPRAMSNETSDSATTPGKRFVTQSIDIKVADGMLDMIELLRHPGRRPTHFEELHGGERDKHCGGRAHAAPAAPHHH